LSFQDEKINKKKEIQNFNLVLQIEKKVKKKQRNFTLVIQVEKNLARKAKKQRQNGRLSIVVCFNIE
jgi:hypothetical protein